MRRTCRGARRAVVQRDAAAQRLQRGFVGLALDLRQIGFGRLVLRRRNPRLQRAVVGQDQQALAIAVEPPAG